LLLQPLKFFRFLQKYTKVIYTVKRFSSGIFEKLPSTTGQGTKENLLVAEPTHSAPPVF
jgi:hypothetical protein